MNKSIFKTLMLAVGATTLAASLIIFPEQALEASIRGLNMWWEIVFPSLLPFFIISELLISFGVVAFIGVLLEPLMRPLFKVPGVGGFVWAMGMASGYPSGAKLTARLRKEKQITKIEAERLVSFTNSSNPLFIFGAVSIGFFQNPALGIMLALAHYAGNFFVGLCMRFYGGSETKKERPKKISLRTALKELHRTRIQERRPFGKLLGDAVISSIETLLMIGGFIILFSVINKLLFIIGITEIIAHFVGYLLSLLTIPADFSLPLISGIFEITLGSQMTSGVQNASLLQQAIITSFILGFSGLSVQAQAASILAQTDIRFAPYFFARIMHGLFASVIMFLVWEPVYNGLLKEAPSNTLPVFGPSGHEWASFSHYGPLITIFMLIVYISLYLKKNVKM